jgi:hypothetical protein
MSAQKQQVCEAKTAEKNMNRNENTIATSANVLG